MWLEGESGGVAKDGGGVGTTNSKYGGMFSLFEELEAVVMVEPVGEEGYEGPQVLISTMKPIE
jgi:hypothetical protein